MYAQYVRWRLEIPAPMSVTGQIRAHFDFLKFDEKPSPKAVRTWVDKWDVNGGKFTIKENREYTRTLRKVDSKVLKKAKEFLKDSPSFRKASKKKYPGFQMRPLKNVFLRFSPFLGLNWQFLGVNLKKDSG